MPQGNTDVVIVGAGLAGLAAARECSRAGLRTRVLEARDRVGGRTWSRSFAGVTVDLGAEWISPAQHTAVMAELTRYGIPLAPAPEPDQVFWSLDGRVEVALEILTRQEREELVALYRSVEADAARIDFFSPRWHESVLDLDVPLAEYLDGFQPSAAVGAFFLLHAFALMGADENEYSALNLLHEFAGFGSCQEAFSGESDRIAGGTMSIASAIASEIGQIIWLSTPVRGVHLQSDGTVEVRTGVQALTARAVILAVPVNVLAGMDLNVPLTNSAQEAIAEGHAGAIAKVWATVRGLPTPYWAAGWPDVPESYGVPCTEGTSVAAFQLVKANDSQIATSTALATLQERHPDASFDVESALSHDWVSDRYSRGTWHTARVGQVNGWYDLAAQAGPCFFAGGDLSRRWVGWMDGALTSGVDAGQRAAAYLSGAPVPPVRG